MNKAKLLIVAMLAVFALSGCGGNNTDTSPSPSPAATNDANVGDGTNASGDGAMDNAGKAIQDMGNGVDRAMDNAGNAVRDMTRTR